MRSARGRERTPAESQKTTESGALAKSTCAAEDKAASAVLVAVGTATSQPALERKRLLISSAEERIASCAVCTGAVRAARRDAQGT